MKAIDAADFKAFKQEEQSSSSLASKLKGFKV
jgi:hypothetical protein